MPNTPLRELIRQTPVIAVCTVFLIVIICALILSIFVAKNCFDIQRRKLQSNDTKVCKDITQLDKSVKKSNDIFSDEDTDFVRTVVKQAAGNPPCESTHTRTNSSCRFPVVRKCLRLHSVPVSSIGQKQHPVDVKFSRSLSEASHDQQRQQSTGTASGVVPNEHRIRGDGGPEESLSKGSYAVTSFIAGKLYAGLKHPTHHKKFRTIVTELMKATKTYDDSDSETSPLISGNETSSLHQVQNSPMHMAINMDTNASNADSASNDSEHVEEH